MSAFSDLATELFDSGLSCSEAVVTAAEEKLLGRAEGSEELHRIASMFGGGMSSGCACGAVVGAQIVLGIIFGKTKGEKGCLNSKIAAEFITIFKSEHKVTCCAVLSRPYRKDHKAHHENCRKLVKECSKILETLIEKYK